MKSNTLMSLEYILIDLWDFVGRNMDFQFNVINILRSPYGLFTIRSLRSLSFIYVNVNAEVVEFFIYNCHRLERLRAACSDTLLTLKVVSSSIQLKYLDIYSCRSIKEVEISTPNSFLHVPNVPLLLDISKLYRGSLLDLSRMIKACPSLQKFTLMMINFIVTSIYGSKRELCQFPKFRHEHLKVVEFIGFVGHPIDLELAFYLLENFLEYFYLLENSPMLEKIIVNITYPLLMGSYFQFEDVKEKQDARKLVKRLQKRVSQGVQLVIL
ncbi:hypothetical protein ACOSP7_024336 [Xanthoceras sorbifolium]